MINPTKANGNKVRNDTICVTLSQVSPQTLLLNITNNICPPSSGIMGNKFISPINRFSYPITSIIYDLATIFILTHKNIQQYS